MAGKIRPCNSEKLEARRTRTHAHGVPGIYIYYSVTYTECRTSHLSRFNAVIHAEIDIDVDPDVVTLHT